MCLRGFCQLADMSLAEEMRRLVTFQCRRRMSSSVDQAGVVDLDSTIILLVIKRCFHQRLTVPHTPRCSRRQVSAVDMQTGRHVVERIRNGVDDIAFQ